MKTTLDDQNDDDDDDGGNNVSVLKFTKSRMHRTVSLMHFKPHEIAQQLTKIDQEYMRSVNLHELLGSLLSSLVLSHYHLIAECDAYFYRLKVDKRRRSSFFRENC